MPTSLWTQYSFIVASGIMELWPTLISRTDLVTKYDYFLLSKPSVSGNIKVMSYILGMGLGVPFALLLFECVGKVITSLKGNFQEFKYFCVNGCKRTKTFSF